MNREGDAEVIRGLLRPEDRRRAAAAQSKARTARSTRAGGVDADRDDAACEQADASERHAGHQSERTPASVAGDSATPARAEFSEALARRLAAHRTLALQVVLSRNTAVALAALAHSLAQRVLGDEFCRTGTALQITAQAQSHVLTSAADDLKTSPAWLAWQTARDGWIERLPRDRSAWFGWMLELPQADLLELLAFCASATVNAMPSNGAALEANALSQGVDLDMADWWKPTAEGFLTHVSRAQIVHALKEAGPDLARDGVEGMKKEVLVNTALTRLAGTRWLPTPLRPPPG